MASPRQSSSTWHNMRFSSELDHPGDRHRRGDHLAASVEIVPLFYLKSTIERWKGCASLFAARTGGRNIYIREGCYNCHSQMIRPLRDEVERYGHYSLAAESMYDHPFQWGSSAPGRTWRGSAANIPTTGTATTCATACGRALVDHAVHPLAERDARCVPHRPADAHAVGRRRPLHAGDDRQCRRRTWWPRRIRRQGGRRPSEALLEGDRPRPRRATRPSSTELDAVIAYLQRLGTQVDFKLYDDKANIR